MKGNNLHRHVLWGVQKWYNKNIKDLQPLNKYGRPLKRLMKMIKTQEEEMRQVGRRIKELRMAHGVQQSQLAALIGISQTNLSNIERGRTGITLQNLFKIREALQCSMTDFFSDNDSASNGSSLQITDAVQILRLLKNADIKGL